VRDLHQDAGAVAGARVGADRAAVVSASATIWCDLRPLMSAMKPTPHESLSSAGSYIPRAGGTPGSAVGHDVTAARLTSRSTPEALRPICACP
jgi:hypothetical protein